MLPAFSTSVMKATDMKNMTPELTNQEILKVLSLTPIIFMNSFSRTSFSRTMPLTVMATGKSQAKIIARGNTHCMAATYLEGERGGEKVREGRKERERDARGSVEQG